MVLKGVRFRDMGLFDDIFGTPKKKRKVKKKGAAVGNNWKSLQEKGEKSKYFKNCKVETQKVSKSTRKRPDYYCVSKTNPKERTIGDAKNVKTLSKKEIDTVKSYVGHPFYAKNKVVIVKKTTRIPKEVKQYAEKKDVKIDRISAKRKPKK